MVALKQLNAITNCLIKFMLSQKWIDTKKRSTLQTVRQNGLKGIARQSSVTTYVEPAPLELHFRATRL